MPLAWQKSKDDRFEGFLNCPNVSFSCWYDPFKVISPFWGDSSIFLVKRGHETSQKHRLNHCRWSRVAGTLSSTPLVKGAEGLFYSSDLGIIIMGLVNLFCGVREFGWDRKVGGKIELPSGFPRKVVHFLR